VTRDEAITASWDKRSAVRYAPEGMWLTTSDGVTVIFPYDHADYGDEPCCLQIALEELAAFKDWEAPKPPPLWIRLLDWWQG
jgi:hypothetical protein